MKMDITSVKIRLAAESDLPAILSIYNDAIINTTAVYQYRPQTPEFRRQWFEDKKKEGFPVLVAESAEAVVGFSSYGHFRAWPAYKYSVESSVYVSPDHRGIGIGRALIPPLIEAARRAGLHAVIAGIDSANVASLKLHSHFGFTEVARFKEVGYKFGKWLDLIFMELLLPTPSVPTEN